MSFSTKFILVLPLFAIVSCGTPELDRLVAALNPGTGPPETGNFGTSATQPAVITPASTKTPGPEIITSANLPDTALVYEGKRYVVWRTQIYINDEPVKESWQIRTPFGARQCSAPTVEACVEALKKAARDSARTDDRM